MKVSKNVTLILTTDLQQHITQTHLTQQQRKIIPDHTHELNPII